MILKYIYLYFLCAFEKGKGHRGMWETLLSLLHIHPHIPGLSATLPSCHIPPAPPPRASAKPQLTQVLLSLQTALREKTQGTTQESLSCSLYLPKRRVNEHGDLCHGHCQGLDDGHALGPSECHG